MTNLKIIITTFEYGVKKISVYDNLKTANIDFRNLKTQKSSNKNLKFSIEIVNLSLNPSE